MGKKLPKDWKKQIALIAIDEGLSAATLAKLSKSEHPKDLGGTLAAIAHKLGYIDHLPTSGGKRKNDKAGFFKLFEHEIPPSTLLTYWRGFEFLPCLLERMETEGLISREDKERLAKDIRDLKAKLRGYGRTS